MKYNHPRFLFRRYTIMRIIIPNNSFLEIGPGNLCLAIDLSKKFRQGTLIDFNTTNTEAIFDKLPDEIKSKLKLIIADFCKCNQFDVLFNCIISCDVLEHVEKDDEFLKKTNDLLFNNGQLIISVPARKKFWSFDDEIVGHFRRYEKPEIINKLTLAGFSKIKIFSYGFPFTNLIRFFRVKLAKRQYDEKSKWDRKKQSQLSAFLVNRKSILRLAAIIINKYTLYPLFLISSLFNRLDLAEGYVISAIKNNSNTV